jgi:FKBP-type peptidyl-prolyl cis-trans isomerase 2
MAKITKIQGDKVTLDANPQLAGKVLHFDIELVDIT